MSARDKVVLAPAGAEIARDHALDALNVAEVQMDRLTKLRAILRAIRDLASDDSTIGGLAKVGVYLADDFLDCADGEQAEMSAKFDALKAGQS
jgi:hypothetical protein